MKAFNTITSLSLFFSLTIATLSIIGITITGLYPAIAVFLFIALIPIASKLYAKNKPGQQRYPLLTALNVLVILVVLWMTFVIVHDRVLGDCC